MNLWRLSVDFHMWYVWWFLCVVCHVSFHYPPYETVCCCYQTVFSYLSLMLCLWWLISSPHLPFIVLLSCPTFPLPSPSFLSLHLLSLPLLMSSSSFTFPSLLPPCSIRDKFVEVDLKPVCKHCYERLPDDMKRRLAKRERDSKEKKKKLIPMCLWSLSFCSLLTSADFSFGQFLSSLLSVSVFSYFHATFNP